MRPNGEQELLALLEDIDARLAAEGAAGRVTLYVFGGAAVVIAYGAKRGTIDIDGLLEDESLERKLVEWAGEGAPLAKKHGIYFQRANLTLMPIEDPDWKERCVELLKGRLKHVRMMALGAEDLVLSKLGRYNDRDREDIAYLAGRRSVDVDKLISLYKSARRYYVGRLETLDLTFNLVLEEEFGRRPMTFAGETGTGP